ncbi:MAG: hypothetical protein ACT4OX_06270 [Actinomycetota bacterium]
MTTEDPAVVSALPMEWDAGDASVRTSEGWRRSEVDPTLEVPVALSIEGNEGSASASLVVDEISKPLAELDAMSSASLQLHVRGFDQDGVAVAIDVSGADGALLTTARFERQDSKYSGPAVGAFVTAKRGDDVYFFSAIAKDEPGNAELVEEIARSLSID